MNALTRDLRRIRAEAERERLLFPRMVEVVKRMDPAACTPESFAELQAAYSRLAWKFEHFLKAVTEMSDLMVGLSEATE